MVLLQQKENFPSAYLCLKWMLYYEILPKVEQISEYLFTYLVTQCLTRKVGAGMFCHFAYGEMCSGF